MAGFKGKYEYTVDDKGRLSLPAKLRKHISPEASDTFVITRGHDQCLYLYPQDVWNKLEEDFKERLNVNREEDRLYLRTILMWSHEVGLDKQSRISIPTELIEFAEIQGNVLVIGSLEKIEIWNPTSFKNYLARYSDHPFEDVASRVMGGATT